MAGSLSNWSAAVQLAVEDSSSSSSAAAGDVYTDDGLWNYTGGLFDVTPDDEDEFYETPACRLYNFIMYAVIGGLLCLLGMVGNILAFVVFWCDKVKTSTSLLFQGLSVIDTAMLAVAFPLYAVTNFLEYTGLSDEERTHSAKVYLLPLAFIAQTATIWVTVLVAFNRYIAVCQPFKAARLCTVVQAKRQLTVVLIFSILYNVPKFAEVLTPNGLHALYYIIYSNILYLIVLLILPLLSLTIVNVRLIGALKELKRKRQEMQQSARQAQDNNVTLVLIIVVIVFSVCQAPALLNQIFWNVLGDEARDCGGFQFYFSRISNMLVVFNSAVNFPIYAVFNTRFRQVLTGQVLPCLRRVGGGGADGGAPQRGAAKEAVTKAAPLMGGSLGRNGGYAVVPLADTALVVGDDEGQKLVAGPVVAGPAVAGPGVAPNGPATAAPCERTEMMMVTTLHHM